MNIQKSIVLICILALLLIIIGNHPMATDQNQEHPVFQEIDDITNKVLKIDTIIAGIHCHYYLHQIHDIIIKDDYLLVHIDPDTSDIITYEKQWTDETEIIQTIETTTITSLPMDSDQIYWKQLVLFPDIKDTRPFFEINEGQQFPLICWEVRLQNGKTYLFDMDQTIIGTGVPAPSPPKKGFSLTGYCQEGWEDCWLSWRQSANYWFNRWCTATTSISLPTPQTISSYVSNSDFNLFYELAHGASTYFQADSPGSNYYASYVNQDMEAREKMRFAFIGSCEGMTNTDAGTFSHEFRKGSMQDTVTIGYSGMGSCPGWSDALDWQEHMFYAMDVGYTIKESFDMATLQYPAIAPAVRFVGDTTMDIIEVDPDDEDPLGIPPHVLIYEPLDGSYVQDEVTITGKADDMDGKVEQVFLQFDVQGSWMLANGTKDWDYSWDTTTVEDGIHIITIIAMDNDGLSSCCRYLTVNVSNAPLQMDLQIPEQAMTYQTCVFKADVQGGIPPYFYRWDLGDGTISYTPSVTHQYRSSGEFQITCTITDGLNNSIFRTKTIVIDEKDEVPPNIILTKPTNGIYINNKQVKDSNMLLVIGSIDIHIDAWDEQSGMDHLDLYINDQLKTSLIVEPYVWTWDEQRFGRQTIRIEGCDQCHNWEEITLSLWKLF